MTTCDYMKPRPDSTFSSGNIISLYLLGLAICRIFGADSPWEFAKKKIKSADSGFLDFAQYFLRFLWIKEKEINFKASWLQLTKFISMTKMLILYISPL